MASLLIENGPDRGQGLELAPDTTYTIGRDAHCDLIVRDDLASRQHCQVKEFRGSWYVRDLKSRNGTLLNDRPVSQAELHFGDKIQIGSLVLTLLEENLVQARRERMLGGYRLLERIGRGGMGTVFRANQVSLDREVALKVLAPDLVKDATFVSQFLREAKAAGGLNHPHIVQVYDVGREGETYFYSMEYVGGGSLEDRLREHGALPTEEALQIALQAALALEFAESRHIVHRDIKPDNLMLTEDGRVKVADLGLALSLKGTAEHAGQPILGTPHFISPEQALRRDVDIRSDIYSLGATLYRMLGGQTVFQGDSAEEIIKKAVREEPRPLRELAPEVPERVAALVHRMLQKDPAHRFASARELREELERLTHRRGRTVALWSALGVAALAVAMAVVFALRRPEKEIVTVGQEDVVRSREAEFRAKSQLERTEIELLSVRDYLAIHENPQPREQVQRQLAAWIAKYDYLTTAEMQRARTEVRRLEQENEQEERRLAALEQQRGQRLQRARETSARLLQAGDPGAALRAAGELVPDASDDAASAAALAGLRLELETAAVTQLRQSFAELTGAVEALIAQDEVAAALARVEQGSAQFEPPPDALPQPLAAELAGFHDWFLARERELRGRLDAQHSEHLQQDLRQVVEAFGPALLDDLQQLRFAEAAARLEAVAGELQTDSYRNLLQQDLARLQAARALWQRFRDELEAGTLPHAPLLQVGNMERPAELEGMDAERREFKVRVSAGVAQVRSQIPAAQFASPGGLRQLFWDRLELSEQDRSTLLGTMLLLEVAGWARQAWDLAPGLQSYSEAAGWVPPAGTPPASGSGLEQVVAGLPAAAIAAAWSELEPQFQRERRCAQDLQDALEAYRATRRARSWHQVREQIEALFAQHRDSLLLRLTYGLLDARHRHALVGLP